MHIMLPHECLVQITKADILGAVQVRSAWGCEGVIWPAFQQVTAAVVNSVAEQSMLLGMNE